MSDMYETAINPYVGPRAFKTGEMLYGRDWEMLELLDLLIAERIVLVYSPSGAGKTSLIQAALIPKLQAEGFEVLPVMRVNQEPPPNVRQDDPMFNRYILSLLLSLEEALPVEQQMSLDELVHMEFTDYLERWPTADGDPDNDVLIFDQFEEILTIDPTDKVAKTAFFTQLGVALHNRRRWALCIMREDFVAGLDPYLRLVPTQLNTIFRLDLLGIENAYLAIQRPALAAGVNFTEAAVLKLINDLSKVRVQRPDGTIEEQQGAYIEPVQLQVVCRRLWEKLFPDVREIVASDIAMVGDVDNALADYYAERMMTIASETGVDERAIREWVNRHLITEQGIRGQVLQGPEQSQELANRVIWLLVNAHLVRAEQRRGAIWFELTHDRLIEPIRNNNAAWFETNLSLLQRQAALWGSQGRPDGLLLRGQALAEAEAWASDHPNDLTRTERDFLAKCQAAREGEERERQHMRRLRILAIATSVVSVVAIIAFAVALVFYTRSEQQKSWAISRGLAALAISNLEIDPERSIWLALHAVSVTNTLEAEDALQRAVQASRAQFTLVGHTHRVTDAAFSPDGTRFATGSEDGTAKVWDATSGNVLLTFPDHTNWVHSVAFSRDGARLATASADQTAKIWDITSGNVLRTLSGHTHVVHGIAFSRDGTRVATASWDKTAKIWDATSGNELITLSDHAAPIKNIAFSPDGMLVATASDDKTAKLWDITTGKIFQTLSGHSSMVYRVTFSWDGRRVATASDDKTVQLWDVASGKELLTLSGHTQSVHGIAFSPDGKHVATASVDGTVNVWDAASGKALLTLAGHSGPVDSVTYSSDGTHLISASRDKTAKVWSAAIGHTAAVTGVAFSLDATRMATASDDWTAKVWDIATGTELRTLLGHADRVKDVAFSPDGKRIVTGSDDKTAKIWDVNSGRELRTLRGHTDYVTAVAFSPDGTRVATAGMDKTALVWDAHTGQPLSKLFRHTNWISGVAFHVDGNRLFTAGGDSKIRIWDISSGTELSSISADSQIRGMALSRDGTRVATASDDGKVTVWNTDSGKRLFSSQGHSNAVHGIAFSPDGTRLATASLDRTAIIWDANSGTELRTLNHTAGVSRLTFSPDGKYLTTASTDSKVSIYLLKIEDLMALARKRITRTFSAEECRKYLQQPQCLPIP